MKVVRSKEYVGKLSGNLKSIPQKLGVNFKENFLEILDMFWRHFKKLAKLETLGNFEKIQNKFYVSFGKILAWCI